VTVPVPVLRDSSSSGRYSVVVPGSAASSRVPAAEAVLELDRDFPLRAKMGRRGHEAAYSSLGWPSDAREFVAQLESWAKSGSGTL
jgi:hypothetical protein